MYSHFAGRVKWNRARNHAGGEQEEMERVGAGGGRGPIWLCGDGLKVLNEKQLGRHALRFSRFAVFAAEIERIQVTDGIEQSGDSDVRNARSKSPYNENK